MLFRVGICFVVGLGWDVSRFVFWIIEFVRFFGFGVISGEKRYYMDYEIRVMGEL